LNPRDHISSPSFRWGIKFLGFRVELETWGFQVPLFLHLTKQQGMELETSGFKFHSFLTHQTAL